MTNTENTPLIGIDLGTTNSLIAVWEDGKAKLIPNVLDEYLTPSVVSVDEDGQILIGQAAKSRLITHPDRTFAAFKRFMGSKKTFKVNDFNFTPPELAALILKSLKKDAETYLKQDIKDVVISVPAYFSNEQRNETRFAAELAGLNAVRLINEPTAAALAYGLDHDEDEETVIVFDLGGGTFDVTLLDIEMPLIEIHASTGDNYLGGEDFTAAIMQYALKEWAIKLSDLTPQERSKLYSTAEAFKCQYSIKHQNLEWEWQDENYSLNITDDLLNKIYQELLTRIRQPLEKSLRDAKKSASDIDKIILVGGATKSGIIQQLVSKLFKKLPFRHLDPDTVVALGAATQAANRARDETIEEMILTDVCPYTLGIAVHNPHAHDLLFQPIIERNTIIPTSRLKPFSAMSIGQKSINVSVYQGDRPFVKDNILVDQFEVNLPKGDVITQFDIRFSYDINGLLEVDVLFTDTNSNHNHAIDRSPVGLTDEQKRESQERLKRLKIHPRETLANRTLMARLDEAFAKSSGQEREMIYEWIQRFLEAMNQQDDSQITKSRKEINNLLDNLL